MSKRQATVVVAVAVSALGGCAAKPRNYTIAPSYVSAIPYEGLSCRQLRIEQRRVRPALASALAEANYGANRGLLGMAYGGEAAFAEVAHLKGVQQAIGVALEYNHCEDAGPAAPERGAASARPRGAPGVIAQAAASPAPNSTEHATALDAAAADAKLHRADRKIPSLSAPVPAPPRGAHQPASSSAPWWAGPARQAEQLAPSPWWVGVQAPLRLGLVAGAVSPARARLAEAQAEQRRAWRAEARGAMGVVQAAARVAEADARDATQLHDPEAPRTVAAARSARAAMYALIARSSKI